VARSAWRALGYVLETETVAVCAVGAQMLSGEASTRGAVASLWARPGVGCVVQAVRARRASLARVLADFVLVGSGDARRGFRAAEWAHVRHWAEKARDIADVGRARRAVVARQALAHGEHRPGERTVQSSGACGTVRDVHQAHRGRVRAGWAEGWRHAS
jgi:hypothetical protein